MLLCVCVCGTDLNLSWSLFTVFLGELEKQQGAKTHSIKNNGTQLELRGRQGSPSGTILSENKYIFCISHYLHSVSV